MEGETKMRRMAVGGWLLVAGVAMATGVADACTGMYAGKGVTVDGSVLIGRTVDFAPYNATMCQQICEPGTQVSFGGKVNKYRYICVPKATSLYAGRYAGSMANEKGVILTGTITGATNPEVLKKDPYDPVVDKDVGEPNLPDYLIGNAATAREAVELLASAVAERGHDGAEIYMAADTNEAWYVEVYTGHHWAAVKMPEDKVAVFGNHFNLRGVDTNDTENVMFSPGLVEFAVTNDFAVWTDGTKTKLDLYKTFADLSSVETKYANYRAYYGHMRFADQNLPDYRMDLLPELFFTPGYEIAPTNMFELMRARYEDLSDEELPTPRTNFAIRVIGTVKQGNCHVLQLDCRADTPEGMRGTVWSCLGAAEHGVFHPINASQDVLPDAYTNDAQRTFGYDPNRAADAFRRLSALTEANRKYYGPGVRAYWHRDEVRRAVEWPEKLDEAIRANDTAALSSYTFNEEERSFADAKTLYDKLMWYAADNNHIKGDGSGATDGPTEPFDPFGEQSDSAEGPEDDGGSCTGFYVGRKVSADGTTLIGRTADPLPFNGPFRVDRYERVKREYFDGTVNTWAFHSASKVTSQNKGFYGGGTINEKGVMLTGTVTAETREEAIQWEPFRPVSEGGVGEPNLPDYMIGKAATAREAVEILGKMIAEHGHAGAEIYMVADANEAWYVEVYTGHEWAAVKMPDDKVAGFGNAFGLRGFKMGDENVMCSTNLVGLAVQHGFVEWVDEDHGIIDLMATYSRPLWDNPNYRSYWIHRAWAPTAYKDEYKTDTYYPLFFKPEHPVEITNVFELMRTRYEGSDHSPDEGTNTDIRVIGTTRQQSSHVLQMRHGLPEAYRCTLWECLAQAEHSTYLPVCMAVKGHPDAYSRDQDPPLEYDPVRAADAFLRLDTLAELKRFVVDTYGKRQDVRPFYGAGVRAFWRAQEARLAAEWPRKLEEWISAEDEAGCAAATAYVNFNQVWTLADAKRLHDELAWYWTEFNCDLRDGGGATDVPTYPFASSMPTNAELGATWTRWHRAEFDAYVEDLAGDPGTRRPSVAALVDESKRVFDGVKNAATLSAAKTRLDGIVEALCAEVAKPIDVPVITVFKPDFTQGPTTEVPNVYWNISGPFDRVALTIDETTVYTGDTRCGEGRWRDLCRPGTHRLKLTAGYGEEEVTSSCFYTALLEGDEPAVLPMIGYFYPDYYVGQKGTAPLVHWDTLNITSFEIWLDGACILMSQNASGEFRFSQLNTPGSYVVRMVAHNAIEDAEASFCYRCEAPVQDQLTSAPLLGSADQAPAILTFEPDAYAASIRETPYIRWNLSAPVDALKLVIDEIPVFIGDGKEGSGRWLDVSGLNLGEMTGSHEVSLSVSNSVGVATSNFTCTCYWEEPPPPPIGSEENPWGIGEDVQAYTNGSGALVIVGGGATSNYTDAATVPWAEVVDEIEEVDVSGGITRIGSNLWAGLKDGVIINMEAIAMRKMISAGFPEDDPVGAVSPAEFERIDIIDGKAYLDVSVYTNDDVTATTGSWGVATNEVIEVPAPGKTGFFILKSKGAK